MKSTEPKSKGLQISCNSKLNRGSSAKLLHVLKPAGQQIVHTKH